MEDMVLTDANAIAEFLTDRKCSDIAILDLRPECSWTDCFVIATVNSNAHLRGVAHHLWGALNELGISVNNRQKRLDSEGWELIDCGHIIIHLMNNEMREFYALEKLWQRIDD